MSECSAHVACSNTEIEKNPKPTINDIFRLYGPAHVHFIVPGGAIGKDGASWLKSRNDFFIPVRAASLIYRAKYKAAMKRAGLMERIDSEVTPEVWRKAWNVNSQAVGDGALALKYLAPYVFRVAIGNHRIVSVTDGEDCQGEVTFLVKRTGTNRYQSMTVSAQEFIRRYLQHVLPRGFQKVRHFGFAHPRAKTNWERLTMMVTVTISLIYVLTVQAKPIRERGRSLFCVEGLDSRCKTNQNSNRIEHRSECKSG